jgi:NitT/TauT family transport system substrate-binding protein
LNKKKFTELFMKSFRLSILFLVGVMLMTACGPSAPEAAPVEVEPTQPQQATIEPTQIPVATLQPTEAPTPTELPLVKVKACYTAVSGTQTIVPYVFEKGLFKKYGLDVDLQQINGGTATVSALLAGDIDICQVAGSPAVNAVIAKQDIRIIAGFFNIYPASFFVSSDIKSAADLKGKVVGINAFGDTTDPITRAVLKNMGLDAEKDVTLLPAGETPQRMAAMVAKKISGALFIPPATETARQNGFVEMVNLNTIDLPYQHTGVITTGKYIKEHREVVLNFMKAIVDGIAMMKKDPVGAKEVIAKYTKLDPVKDAKTLDVTYEELIIKDLSSTPYPTLPGIQYLLDGLVAKNPDAASVTPDMVVDTSFLKELEDSGFIAAVQK